MPVSLTSGDASGRPSGCSPGEPTQTRKTLCAGSAMPRTGYCARWALGAPSRQSSGNRRRTRPAARENDPLQPLIAEHGTPPGALAPYTLSEDFMRISAARATSVIAVAAVAVLGAQYASAAPSHDGRKGQPNISPIRNINYQYSTSTAGGTGDVVFDIPNPPKGFYSATFTANFFPEGSPAAPETFACSLIKDGSTMRAQSTVSTS